MARFMIFLSKGKILRAYHIAVGFDCMIVTPPSIGTTKLTLLKDVVDDIHDALYW